MNDIKFLEMKDIFTLKNFGKSLILGFIGLIIYYLIGLLFNLKRDDWMIYVVMYFTFFLINFVVGNGNRPWKDFLTLKKRND